MVPQIRTSGLRSAVEPPAEMAGRDKTKPAVSNQSLLPRPLAASGCHGCPLQLPQRHGINRTPILCYMSLIASVAVARKGAPVRWKTEHPDMCFS